MVKTFSISGLIYRDIEIEFQPFVLLEVEDLPNRLTRFAIRDLNIYGTCKESKLLSTLVDQIFLLKKHLPPTVKVRIKRRKYAL